MSRYLNEIGFTGSSRRYVLFILLLFSISILDTNAQKNDRLAVVGNLRYQWMVSSADTNQLQPYVSEIHKPTFLHFELNLDRHHSYHLELIVPEKSSLFIENQIVRSYQKKSTIYLSVDSLKDLYHKEKLLMTVFSEQNLTSILETHIVDLRPLDEWQADGTGLEQSIRLQDEFLDFKILSLLIVIVTIALIRNAQLAIFAEYFSIKKLFTIKAKSEVLYSMSLFSTANIAILLFYGIVVGFSLINLIVWLAPDELIQRGYGSTFGATLLSLMIFALVFLFIVLKHLMLKLVAGIFLFRRSTSIHFYEYLRLSIVISFVIFVIALFNNFSGGLIVRSYGEFVGWGLVVLLASRSILVFFKLNKLQSFRKLHLFSYLCSTEIIPLIILLKIFRTYIGVF